MKKSELRQQQIKRLKKYVNFQDKKQEDSQLLEKFLGLKIVKDSQTFGVTASLPMEVDTSELIARLWDQGKEVYLAKARTDQEHTLDFLHYTYKSKLVRSNLV